MQNSHFKPLGNACHQVQFQKNLMLRVIEKFKNVDFRSKIEATVPHSVSKTSQQIDGKLGIRERILLTV